MLARQGDKQMSLTTMAGDFILHGSESLGIINILNECVDAGTVDGLRAVQMLYEDMYGGISVNYLLKAPAAYCLIRWGEQGLDALVEAALRTPSSKNNSLAVEVLATLSSGLQIPRANGWINDEGLVHKVLDGVHDWSALYAGARRRLGTYILSFEDDQDAVMAIGMQLQRAFFTSPKLIKSIFSAMAGRWMSVSIPTLQEYENLLRESADDEPRFQSFFEQHPQILDPMASSVWSRPRIHGAKEPDFIIRRSDDTYLVIEIETPGKPILTSSNRISAGATHAVAQVTDYVHFLMERLSSVQQELPSFRQPDALVVVGMENLLNEQQARALRVENDSRHRVRVVGFDWLAARARGVANNVIEGQVRVIQHLRIS